MFDHFIAGTELSASTNERQRKEQNPHCMNHQHRSTIDAVLSVRYDYATTVKSKTYSAVTPEYAHMNLPPAVNLETVEEARTMLEHWEMWNIRLQQQLQVDNFLLPMSKVNGRAAAFSSLPCDQCIIQGETSDDALPCKQKVSENLRPHTTLDSRSRPARGAVCPFAVAYRTTAATTQRKFRPKSTRSSRALLLKRALGLVWKSLGRAGSDAGTNMSDPKQMLAERQTTEERSERKSPPHVTDSSTRAQITAGFKEKGPEKKSKSLAVVERLQSQLQTGAWLLATDSWKHTERESFDTESKNDASLGWPKPPSRLYTEFKKDEEAVKAKCLVPPVLASVVRVQEKEEGERPSRESSPLDTVLADRVANEEQKDQQFESVDELGDFDSDSDPPSQGLPTVPLKEGNVSGFSTFSGKEFNVELDQGASAHQVADHLVEATNTLVDKNDENEEALVIAGLYRSPAISARRSANVEVCTMTFEGKESNSTGTTNTDAVTAESVREKEDYWPGWEEETDESVPPVNDRGKLSFEKGVLSQDEFEECSTEIVNAHGALETYLARSSNTNALIFDEYVNRIALMAEEGLQLYELWQLHYTESMIIKEEYYSAFRLHASEKNDNIFVTDFGKDDGLRYQKSTVKMITPQQKLYVRHWLRYDHPLPFRRWRLKGRERKMCSTFLSGNEGSCRAIETGLRAQIANLYEANTALKNEVSEREAALCAQVQSLEACLCDTESALQRVSKEKEMEALCRDDEISRMGQLFIDLQERQAEREKTVQNLQFLLQSSDEEISQLKRCLEEKQEHSRAIETGLRAQIANLYEANTALKNEVSEREAALCAQVQSLEACLCDTRSALKRSSGETGGEALCRDDEISRMGQLFIDLQERQAEREKTVQNLQFLLQSSDGEISQLKRCLEEKQEHSRAIETGLRAQIANLYEANTALKNEVSEREAALCAQVQSLEARLCDTESALQQVREEAAGQVRGAEERILSIESAADALAAKIQGEALESSFREHRALKLAATLERELLLAKSRVEEYVTKAHLVSLELSDVERSVERARAQTSAALEVIARCGMLFLAGCYLAKWARRCRETRCRTLERVQRESNERRRELKLWCDHICIADTAAMEVRQVRGVLTALPANAITAAGVEGPSSPGRPELLVALQVVRHQLAQEQQRGAELLTERDALRGALRDSTAANSELLAHLEAALLREKMRQ